MRAIHWSDNDRYFGPFTYASGDYKRLAAVLGSGDGDDYPGCRLRVSVGSRTLIVALPPIIRPAREWVDTSNYGWSNGPGSGYWDTREREFGLSYSEGFLQVFHGAQTNDSRTDRTWCKHLPWTQWRHVRHSIYGLDGKLFADLPQGRFFDCYAATEALENACPSALFEFDDFDGERILATTRIEEREWLFGEGWFKWLSLFRRPKVRRSLDIRFSAETGRRKGSWKGGTIGTGIDMLPGEQHESAFRRYCSENGMTFVASVDTHPKDGDAKQAPLVSGAVGEAETPQSIQRADTHNKGREGEYQKTLPSDQ